MEDNDQMAGAGAGPDAAPGPRPRYHWQKDRYSETVFAGYDGRRQMGRIERHHLGYWFWFMTFNHALGLQATAVRGTADSPRNAARACEDCYDAVMAGKWPGITASMIERMLEDERLMLERMST